jgi:hemerythrin-like domain-containing protein
MSAEQPNQANAGRRQFLRGATSAAGCVLAGCVASATPRARHSPQNGDEREEAEVTPGEDLMQEHGVLARILLIYDEAARRIEHAAPLDLALVTGAAGIVRRFVEDYHEKLEEELVFPRLVRAQREAALVAVLLQQHQRGRELTDEITRRAATAATPELAQVLRSFARMYRPHAAREDTVLFPAFRALLGSAGYRELGEQFEDKEQALFGEHGFEHTVAEIAGIESALAIADLAAFTPP